MFASIKKLEEYDIEDSVDTNNMDNFKGFDKNIKEMLGAAGMDPDMIPKDALSNLPPNILKTMGNITKKLPEKIRLSQSQTEVFFPTWNETASLTAAALKKDPVFGVRRRIWLSFGL